MAKISAKDLDADFLLAILGKNNDLTSVERALLSSYVRKNETITINQLPEDYTSKVAKELQDIEKKLKTFRKEDTSITSSDLDATLQQQLQNMESRIKGLQERPSQISINTNSGGSTSAVEGRVKNLENDNVNLKLDLKEAQATGVSNSTQIQKITKDVGDVKETSSSNEARITINETNIKQLQNKQADIEINTAGANNAAANNAAQISELQNSVKSINSTIDTLNKAIMTSQNTTTYNELQDLKKKVDSYRQEQLADQKTLQTTSATATSNQTSIAATNNTVAQNQANVAVNKASIQKLSDAVTANQADIISKLSSANTAMDDRVSTLETAKDDITTAINTMKTDIATNKGNIEAADNAITKNQDSIRKLSNRYLEFETSASTKLTELEGSASINSQDLSSYKTSNDAAVKGIQNSIDSIKVSIAPDNIRSSIITQDNPIRKKDLSTDLQTSIDQTAQHFNSLESLVKNAGRLQNFQNGQYLYPSKLNNGQFLNKSLFHSVTFCINDTELAALKAAKTPTILDLTKMMLYEYLPEDTTSSSTSGSSTTGTSSTTAATDPYYSTADWNTKEDYICSFYYDIRDNALYFLNENGKMITIHPHKIADRIETITANSENAYKYTDFGDIRWSNIHVYEQVTHNGNASSCAENPNLRVYFEAGNFYIHNYSANPITCVIHID